MQLSATSPPDFNNTCRDLTVFKIFPFCQIWLNFSNEFDKKKKGGGKETEQRIDKQATLYLYCTCAVCLLNLS